MTDRPIIFSGPMVRALLDGKKTQTRRLAWREPRDPSTHKIADSYQRPSPWQKVQPGDRLWVRENWQALSFGDYLPTKSTTADVRYAATDALGDADKDVRGYPWRPSIHMPRWASRLTLIVTATKVEPLQAISPDDAWNEGVERRSPKVRQMWLFGADAAERERIYKHACVWEFEDLWKSLHGPEAWDANPDVVALTFRVIRENIDRIEETA